MKYKIVKSENEKKLIKDIKRRLDNTTWYKDGCKQIMFVPIGLVTKNGKVKQILHTDTDLLI